MDNMELMSFVPYLVIFGLVAFLLGAFYFVYKNPDVF